MKREVNADTNSNCCSWHSHQKIGTTTGGLRNKTTSEHDPDYSIAEIGQNTEKSPGELRRLAVTQTPVRTHRLTSVRKLRKGVNNDLFVWIIM